MKNFHSSILFFLLFVISCHNKKISPNDANVYYDKAFSFIEKKQQDSAFYYLNLAKDQFQTKNDSLGMGKSYMQMAVIQVEQTDYFGSEETSANALKFLKSPKDNNYLISVYNTIAIAKNNLKDYKSSLKWYEKALAISSETMDILVLKNNIAVFYLETKDYSSAIKIFEELIKSPTIHQNKPLEARVIDNLAYVKFLQNNQYNAEPQLNKALKIKEAENDLWGQNASYAHLSDYFFKKDKTKALYYAKKLLKVSTTLQNADDRLEALQKIIPLETHENSKKYFIQYQKLDDSLQTARAKARNQFALIRYETEKSKAENEELKAEAAIKENKLLRKNILVGVLIIGLLFLVFWYQRRRKFLAQREQINIKNTKLKYSKKVHDVVANGIYQVLSEVENKDSLDKESLLDKLESIYEKSRDISYENSLPSEKSILLEINELISSFANEDLKILIINDVET